MENEKFSSGEEGIHVQKEFKEFRGLGKSICGETVGTLLLL